MINQQSFLNHFLEHERDLRAFIGSLVADRSRREDVLQEVALTLWEKYASFDQTRPFGAWARGVAANKVLQAKRQDRRFPMPFSPELVQQIVEAFAVDAPTAANLHERGLQHCLAKLPEPSRSLLAQHYEDRLPCAKIASAQGCSVESIYKQLSRLRQQLAACIEGYLKHF